MPVREINRLLVNPHWLNPILAAPNANADPPGRSACGASAGKPARAVGEFEAGARLNRASCWARPVAWKGLVLRQETSPSQRTPNEISVLIFCSRSCHG